MTKNTNVHSEKKQVKDLTLHELNIIYSLVRIGDWADSEIGRFYKLSAEDVRRVFDDYVELLEAAENNPPVQQQLPQDTPQENIEKPRKRRRDAKYATTAERQAAYRDRMKERDRVTHGQPSPAKETDLRSPADPEVVLT